MLKKIIYLILLGNLQIAIADAQQVNSSDIANTNNITANANEINLADDATATAVNEFNDTNQVTVPPQLAAESAPQIEVFSPQFMQSLRQCQPNQEQNETYSVQIIGISGDKCHVKHAGFDLYIPLTIAANIHSFADMHLLLKNPDIAHLDYQPEYIYDGLIYAIDACYHHTDYFGLKQQHSTDNYTASRWLEAEFYNDLCTIRLHNELDIDGAITDYSVICRLTPKHLAVLENRLSELLQKYGAQRGFSEDGRAITMPAQQNKETHQGDVAIMYLLQQEGYCQKMHQD